MLESIFAKESFQIRVRAWAPKQPHDRPAAPHHAKTSERKRAGPKSRGSRGNAPGALSSGFLRGELSSEVQHFSRGGKSEALSGSVIEHIHDLGNFLLGDLPEVGTSREKTDVPGRSSFLPKASAKGMGTREIEGDPQGFLHFLITGKFFPPIPGHGLQWELPVLKQEAKSPMASLAEQFLKRTRPQYLLFLSHTESRQPFRLEETMVSTSQSPTRFLHRACLLRSFSSRIP